MVLPPSGSTLREGTQRGGAPARGSGMEEPRRDSSPVPIPSHYKGLWMSLRNQWAM